MGLFDIFKRRKALKADMAELDAKREMLGIIYDCKSNLEKIVKSYNSVKEDIKKASDIAIEKREEVFEKLKVDTLEELNKLKAQVEEYVELFKKQAAPSDAVEMMKVFETVKKEIEKVTESSLANGPSGPAGPQ